MDEIKAARGQFTFYRSFFDAAQKLPKSKRLGFYEAVINYALDEIMPDVTDSVVLAMFSITKPTLDSARKKAGAGSRGGKISAAVRSQSSDEIASSGEFASTDGASNIEKKKENKKNNEINIKKETETKIESETERKCRSGAGWQPPDPKQGIYRSPLRDGFGRWHYGTNGCVRLTTEEYYDITKKLGLEETVKCISFLDYQAVYGSLRNCTDWPGEIIRCSEEKRCDIYLGIVSPEEQ